jgi:hypothetical protein
VRRRLRDLLDRLRDWWNGPPGRHKYAAELRQLEAELAERVWLPRTPPVPAGFWGVRAPHLDLGRPAISEGSRAAQLHPLMQRMLDGFPTVDAYVEHLFARPVSSLAAA